MGDCSICLGSGPRHGNIIFIKANGNFAKVPSFALDPPPFYGPNTIFGKL